MNRPEPTTGSAPALRARAFGAILRAAGLVSLLVIAGVVATGCEPADIAPGAVPAEASTASSPTDRPADAAANERDVVDVAVVPHAGPDGIWSVKVLVVDVFGEAVADARVALSVSQWGEVQSEATTDASGRATLFASQVPSFVRAHHDDVGRSVAADVGPGLRSSTTLVLARPVRMTAIVVDNERQPVARQQVGFEADEQRAFFGISISPGVVTTDRDGRITFEALQGLRLSVGDDPRRFYLANEGQEFVATKPAWWSPRFGAWHWRYGTPFDAEEIARWDSFRRHDDFGRRRPETTSLVHLDVVMRGGAPCPDPGFYWLMDGELEPKRCYPRSRDGTRYAFRQRSLPRMPAQLLVRGPKGYSQVCSFGPGELPLHTSIALQPPGDIAIRILHRNRRARGVHAELTSWGKVAKARLDPEGIARFTTVHHGRMNVRAMRGLEVLATREVYVPSGGTARATVAVDLSR